MAILLLAIRSDSFDVKLQHLLWLSLAQTMNSMFEEPVVLEVLTTTLVISENNQENYRAVC